MSGPSRRTARSFSSSTGPLTCTASSRSPRRTSHGRPNIGDPRGRTNQRPRILRWLRRTTPPSKRSSRFLPTASTDFEPEAVEARRDARDRRPRMRRLRLDALADQRLEPAGGAAERVALGHAASVAPHGAFVHAHLPVSGEGLNIAAVARRTAVSEHTLRKWEQRYDVLRPTRTEGGQRRYSEGDVSRVEWLAARLRDGYRIGEAAAMLTTTVGTAPRTPEELRDALLAAAARPGPEGLEPLLDHAFALYRSIRPSET